MRSSIIDRPKDYAITVEPIFLNSENIGINLYIVILIL